MLMSTLEFIKKYKLDAIYNHIRYGIPASITLAQGIIESNSGNSILALQANNFFGIKAYSNPNNLPVFYANDDLKGEPFRMYNSPIDSFTDHSKFLLSNKRYTDTLKTGNYVDFAIELKKAGYATSPNYANTIVSVIDKYDLKKYDNIGNNKWLYSILIVLIIVVIIFLIKK